MIPLEIARRARDAAPVHARLRVAAVGPLPADGAGGLCRVALVVESVFRGSDHLSPGQTLTLELHCYLPTEGAPTGPGWLDHGALYVGAVLEAFLERSADGGFQVPLFQIGFATAALDRPDPTLWFDEPATRPASGLLDRIRRALRTRVRR